MADQAAGEKLDLAFSANIGDRYDFVDREARRVLYDSAAQVAAAGITARPSLSPDRLTVSYSVAIAKPELLDFKGWGFQVAHVLYDVRALLDNIMWRVVHDNPRGTLTPKQEKDVYLPMFTREEQWDSFAVGPIGHVIRPVLLSRLREVQPFARPEHVGLAGLAVLSKLHLSDKHREPIEVHLIPDWQMPPPLLYPTPRHDLGHLWIQLGSLTRPIFEGRHLTTIRFAEPLAKEPNVVPLYPAPVFVLAGERYDVQDVLWDAQAALLRVMDTVCLGNTFRADLWDADTAWRRDSVAALNRSLTEGTNEWEQRGFNQPSPYAAIANEMRKDSLGSSEAPLAEARDLPHVYDV